VFRRIRWDEGKAERNLRKHRVSFDEAATVLLGDPLLEVEPDEEHSWSEDRFIAIGESGWGRVFIMAFTVRGDEAWLITARKATAWERRSFMSGDRIRDDYEAQPSGWLREPSAAPRYIQRVGTMSRNGSSPTNRSIAHCTA
jgi:uncharacterized DUF497 family protein